MMQLPAKPLELTVFVRAKLRDVAHPERRVIAGCLLEICDFDQVEQALDASGLLRTWSTNKARRFLEFNLPDNYFFALPDFLQASNHRISVPSSFFIEQLDYSHPQQAEATPPPIQRYVQSVRLFSALKLTADDVRTHGSDECLIWLGQRKLEMSPDYTAEDLVELPMLDEFIDNYIEDGTHKSQKNIIIKEVSFELFSTRTQVTLAELMHSFQNFFDRVKAGYELYVSEFSYEKIRNEVEKEKLNFITRINQVFADIQNQLLTVPLALILVGSQMKSGSSQLFNNVVILLGAIAFSFFLDDLASLSRTPR